MLPSRALPPGGAVAQRRDGISRGTAGEKQRARVGSVRVETNEEVTDNLNEPYSLFAVRSSWKEQAWNGSKSNYATFSNTFTFYKVSQLLSYC